MSDLTNDLTKVEGQHREALQWYADNVGLIVPWSKIASHANNDGPRLANLAKGIYKPAYTELALSVKQMIASPYADSNTDSAADGSWTSLYFQEGTDPGERDNFATNRGLMKCMEQGVPIGALLQTKAGKGALYHVLGLARVTNWENGFFSLSGYSESGELVNGSATTGPAATLKKVTVNQSAQDNFDPDNIDDLRQRVISEVVSRRGQPKFRNTLLEAYAGKCAITKCDAVDALEAAHISPYLGVASNHPQNGILLRADIHSLFDLGLIGINPETLRVRLSERLKGTSYADLEGIMISLPEKADHWPDKLSLGKHWKWSGL